MKKTKLLMPILGVGAIAATVAPMVAITGCNKEESAWKIVEVEDAEEDHKVFNFILQYTKSLSKDLKYSAKPIEESIPTWCSIKMGAMKGSQVNGTITLTKALQKNESKKVPFQFKLLDVDTEEEIATFSITITCVYQEQQ
ncbi:MAG: hypothetical protein ACOQNV_03310 [Mycoplasmoidaceae bacterium]